MQSAIKASVVAVIATSASAFELKSLFSGHPTALPVYTAPATVERSFVIPTAYPGNVFGSEVKAASGRMATEFQGLRKEIPTGVPSTVDDKIRSGAAQVSGEFSGLRNIAPTGYPTQTYAGLDREIAGLRSSVGDLPTGYPAHTDVLAGATGRVDGEIKGIRSMIPTGYPRTETLETRDYPTGSPEMLGNFRDVVSAHLPTEGTYPTGYPTYNHEIPTRTVQVGVPVIQAPESVTVPRLQVTETRNTVQFPTATVPHFNLGLSRETINLPTGHPTF